MSVKMLKLALFSSLVALTILVSNTHQHQQTARKKCKLSTRQLDFCRSWQREFEKFYNSKDEEEEACVKLLINKKKIDEHNKLYAEGKVKHLRKLWKYSDMSFEEKQQALSGLSLPPGHSEQTQIARADLYPKATQKFLDYRSKLGPARDQGGCPSCWAFSAAYIVEGLMRKQNVSNANFSVQQLVDCDSKIGCTTGWPKFALDYVRDNGITDEVTYPYTGQDQNCSYSEQQHLKGYVNETFEIATRGDEILLKNMVTAVGPVSVAVCVEDDFFSYSKGIYYNRKCCTNLNHALTIVGYGIDPLFGDYWIVMNSWGESWGEKGFGKYSRNAGNMCNIAYYGVYAS